MKITIHNPAQLPVIDYRKIIPIQGDLKDLTETNYQKLKKSMEQNGFKIPAFVWKPAKNEEVIIEGAPMTITKGLLYNLDSHQRIRVLTKENATPREIPYVLIHAENFQDAKKTLLLISSQYGTLTAEGFDNFTFDIDQNWINEVLHFDGIDLLGDETKPNSEEDNYEIPDNIATDIKRGDLFEIGTHRLICGDCTNKDDVEKLMNGKKADLYVTDPPYGVSYAAKNKFLNAISRGNRIQTEIIGDQMTVHNCGKLWVEAFKIAEKNMTNKASYYIFSAQIQGLMVMMMMMIDKVFALKHCLIWVKNNHVLGRSDYNYKHEPLLYGWKKKGTHNFYGGFQTSVFEFNKPQKNDLHPTMKPIALLSKFIENSSLKENIIYDSFGGSGSTMVAAHQLNRRCNICEIDEHYCQITIDRMIALDASIIIKKNGEPYIKSTEAKATEKVKTDVKKKITEKK